MGLSEAIGLPTLSLNRGRSGYQRGSAQSVASNLRGQWQKEASLAESQGILGPTSKGLREARHRAPVVSEVLCGRRWLESV